MYINTNGIHAVATGLICAQWVIKPFVQIHPYWLREAAGTATWFHSRPMTLKFISNMWASLKFLGFSFKITWINVFQYKRGSQNRIKLKYNAFANDITSWWMQPNSIILQVHVSEFNVPDITVQWIIICLLLDVHCGPLYTVILKL